MLKVYSSEKEENKEINESRLDSFQKKKCVEIFFSSANYICRNEYIFSFYTKLK